jgi:hypothetical protein
MMVPLVISSRDGEFTATLAGAPELHAVGSSHAGAIAALKKDILKRTQQGELTWIDIESSGVSGLAGSFANDPTLREICADIYREHDAELQ